MTGILYLADSIKVEMEQLLPGQRKTQRGKLSLLVATLLDARSANLMDLAAGLPREADRTGPLGNAQRYMRYQWITRLLGNPLVISDAIMEPFSREVLEQAAGNGAPLTLILDQSKTGADARAAASGRCRWPGGSSRRDRVRDPEIAARGGRPLAAGTGQGAAAGLLRHRRPDRLVPGARHRLRLKGNLVVVDGAGRTTTGQGPGLLFGRRRADRAAGANPYRHHPRSRAPRAPDHRDV